MCAATVAQRPDSAPGDSRPCVPTAVPSRHRILTDRWLGIVCEAKVVLHSISGPETLELPRSLVDGKAATCVALLLLHHPGLLGGEDGAGRSMAPRFAPLLAIGTSGGNIYVVDPLTAKVCEVWGPMS